MSAQLDQILGYLDRDGVSEVVLSTGRPIAIRQNEKFANLTAKALTSQQLIALLQGTDLLSMIPEADGTRPPTDLAIGARRVRALVGRRGDEVVVRIERAPAAAQAAQAKGAAAAPATKGSTSAARTKTPTALPIVAGARARKPSSVPLDLELGPSTTASRALELDPVNTPVRPDGPLGHGMDFDLEPGGRAPEPVARAPEPAARAPVPAARTQPLAAAPRPATAGDGSPFSRLVQIARERGASDLHIASGRVVSIRVGGDLVPVDPAEPPLPLEAAEAMMMPLLSPRHQELLGKSGYVDLAVSAPGGGRLRANLTRHQNGIKGTFRLALAQPASLEQLGLPAELAKVVHHHQGLVVIAGPSGHGKTTTLAALVDVVNAAKPHHILTVEDPIEIVHPRKAAVVSQREVGPHTRSFATALKASLREDPDVIVIGELRDRETVEIALTASETGHLVVATMSTPSAAKTLDRLIDMFPPEEHSQVRASVAGALRAIVAQRLIPAKNGGVVPAVELVTGVLPLAVLIREDKLYQLPNLMQRGRAFGMIRFDESLAELVRAGKITDEVALQYAESKKDLGAVLRPAPAAPVAPAAGKSRLGSLFGKKEGE